MDNITRETFESYRDSLCCEELKKKAKFQLEYLLLMLTTGRDDAANLAAGKLMILLSPKEPLS